MGPNVLWSADECGYTVVARHGVRVVHRFREETMSAPLDVVRMQAAARAVELALEFRIGLVDVSEAREPLDDKESPGRDVEPEVKATDDEIHERIIDMPSRQKGSRRSRWRPS